MKQAGGYGNQKDTVLSYHPYMYRYFQQIQKKTMLMHWVNILQKCFGKGCINRNIYEKNKKKTLQFRNPCRTLVQHGCFSTLLFIIKVLSSTSGGNFSIYASKYRKNNNESILGPLHYYQLCPLLMSCSTREIVVFSMVMSHLGLIKKR